MNPLPKDCKKLGNVLVNDQRIAKSLVIEWYYKRSAKSLVIFFEYQKNCKKLGNLPKNDHRIANSLVMQWHITKELQKVW